MNIVDILKGLENLVVQLLLMIIYIPKTILKIISDPRWVIQYVDEELDKSDRFEDYVSPVLLYLSTSVVLFIIISMIGSEEVLINSENLQKLSPQNIEAEPVVEFFNNLQGTTAILAAMGFMSVPLFCALLTELFRRAKFSKAHITRVLFIQCYYFSPLVLSILGTYVSFMLFDKYQVYNIDFEGTFLSTVLLIMLIWFVVIQIKFLFIEFQGKVWKSVGVLSMGIAFVIAGFVAFFYLSEGDPINERRGNYEFIEWKLPKKGTYTIKIAGAAMGELCSIELIHDAMNLTYPSSGKIGINTMVAGEIDLTEPETDSLALKNKVSEWEFMGTENDTLMVIIPKEDLMFSIRNEKDSVIRELNYSNETNPDKIIIDKTGNYKITIVPGLEQSIKSLHGEFRNIEYDLALVRAGNFKNNTVRYPRMGSLKYNQKVFTELDEDIMYSEMEWSFKGAKNDLISLYVENIDGPQNSDISIDLINESGDSVFAARRIPKIAAYVLITIFSFAFLWSLINYIRRKFFKPKNPMLS
jgi:hypothetical protein